MGAVTAVTTSVDAAGEAVGLVVAAADVSATAATALVSFVVAMVVVSVPAVAGVVSRSVALWASTGADATFSKRSSAASLWNGGRDV